MEPVLAELIDRGIVEVIGQWDDGEPELRVADRGLAILSRMDEADQARFRPVINAQFCNNPPCRTRIRPGIHHLRVTISTETAGLVQPDLADGTVWSAIFCTPSCAHHQTNFVFLNFDHFNSHPTSHHS